MTKRRRRRKPEQIVKLIQEGQAMLSAGKSEAELLQKLEITESFWQRWNKQFGGMRSWTKQNVFESLRLRISVLKRCWLKLN